jgi:predicted nucleic acid-binding protein
LSLKGLGEASWREAVALYKHLHADYPLVDDKRARKVAQLSQIEVTGSHEVLLLAKHEEFIDHVGPFLERLRTLDAKCS